MGRIWNAIKRGVKKVGRFIGNVAGKVSNVAGFLSNIPVIGGIASTVARGANLVSKIGNGAANLIEKGEQIRQKYQPVINKVKGAAQAIYKTGIPDKLTNGAVSRVIDKGKYYAQRAENAINRGGAAVDRANHTVNRVSGKISGLAGRVGYVVGGKSGRPPPVLHSARPAPSTQAPAPSG